MHSVAGELLGFYWRKGSQPDMKGDEARLNAARLQFTKQRLGEVQAGRGCSDGTWRAGENGLIALMISLKAFRPMNVRWQRHFADLRQSLDDIFRSFKLQTAVTFLICLLDKSADVGACSI